MRTYAAYLRKSRADADKTIEEVLASHRHDLLKLAKSMNVGIVDWYEEVVSGESVSNRPQVQALLDAVSDGKYLAVFCMDIDRLGRGDMMDQGLILNTFRRSETKIITPKKIYDLTDEADETSTEFEAFFARYEYKQIRKRMRRGTIACLENGGYVANAPYGYEQCRIDKKPSLRIVPEEARFVQLAFDRYCAGIGATAIAEELNALGAVPRRNDTFNKNTVRYMLRNPVYCGLTVFNRMRHTKKGYHGADRNICRSNPEDKWLVAPGLHEAIITKEQFAHAQDIRRGKDMPQYHLQGGVIRNQFAGVFRCAKCGKPLVTSISAKGGPYILCRTPECSAMAKSVYVEEYLLSALETELRKLEYADRADLTADLTAADQQISMLEAEIQKAQAKKTRLYSFLEDGLYDRTTFMERMALAEKELSGLTARLQKATSRRDAIAASDTEALRHQLETALTLWPEADATTRNTMLKSLIADAEYTKEKKSKPKDFTINLTLRHF